MVKEPYALVWNPSVHALFRDELVFVLLSVRAFPKDSIYDDLEDFLDRSGHTAYRIYRVLGAVDLILRVWVEKGRAEEFAKELELKNDYVMSSSVVTVIEIPHHWHYDRTVTAEALSTLTPVLVQSLQDSFTRTDLWSIEPVRSAIESLLVRPVTEIDGNITFFTGVPSTNSRGLDYSALLREIYALLEQFVTLEKTAIFRTKGEYSLLIKCETTRFASIGEFIGQLSHKIAVYRCGTVTSAVADPKIRGREEIGRRSFRQVERRDMAVANILPELYEKSPPLHSEQSSEIESFIRGTVVPNRKDLTDDEFKGIQVCLRAVIEQDDSTFLEKTLGLFGQAERQIRSITGRFIATTMGQDKVAETINAVLKRTGNSESKKLDLLALGDRLELIVFILKAKKLTEDVEVTNAWNEEVSLRDQAAHFSEKTFSSWCSQLAILVRFLRRYKKLLAVMKSAS